MASTDIFAHPSNLKYGENLYWRSGRTPSCQNALDMWYNEIKWHNFAKPYFSAQTGHFTQMVWKSSRYLGCASAKSRRTGRVYIAVSSATCAREISVCLSGRCIRINKHHVRHGERVMSRSGLAACDAVRGECNG